MPVSGMRRRDAAALALATVTALAGLTAWLLGEVDLGVRLGAAGDGDLEGFVQVVDVVPDSLAEYYGFSPGWVVVEIQRHDGSMAAQADSPYSNDADAIGQTGEYLRFVTEDVPEREIDYIFAALLDTEQAPYYVMNGSSLNRFQLTGRLEGGGILLLVGIGLGLATAAAVGRGWMGEARRAEGTVAGVAVATPLMALPLLYVGSPGTTVAAASLPALGMLPLAWSLAGAQPTEAWAVRLRGLAVGLALLAIIVASRPLFGADGGARQAALLAVAIALAPAVAGALAGDIAGEGRLEHLTMGLVPAAAALVAVATFPELTPLALLVVGVIAWRAVPARLVARLPIGPRQSHEPAKAPQPTPEASEELVLEHDGPTGRARRDVAALTIGAATFAAGLLTCCEIPAVIFGALFGGIVAFALHRGLLGSGWRTAAIPVGAAVAVPVMALAFGTDGGTQYLARLVLPATAALPVAHLLAWRHPDPAWRPALFALSVVLTVVVGLLVAGSSVGGPLPDGPFELGDSSTRLTIYLALGFIALVPALGGAFAEQPDGAVGPTGRLDLLAIGLTPGAAMTVLPGFSPTFWILGLWILALVAWRRFTIAPLLGMAQRTQRQRDLAVAAVEAERARLAADLHDDALQEISALVRRLDAAGDTENAELARGVAERLRAITSDLRLPLLDDLGAGPALEWLVGRVRPLADGEVTLERSDPDRPPPNVELAVFRVAQEALANAVKHGSTPITVRYRVADDGGVSLSVDDAGPGIEPDAADRALQAGHLGMANMQQRAQQIGALLDVRRWPTGGTHVRLEWRPQ
ncbi:MAG TPA: ATP-binding protein [Candidatus Limnocylindria bacterium]